MAFELPDLPYAGDGLEPHISAQTLELHHGEHHQAYIDKLNDLVEATNLTGLALEEIIRQAAGNAGLVDLFNNAGQVWNHTFLWHSMTPGGGGRPNGELARQIDSDFGGFDSFRKAFIAAATDQFGSGWAWLVVENGRLKVTATPNAVPPMIDGQHALLTCDVWEHAYYLDYQNHRKDFVETFFDELVNWSFAAERFEMRGAGQTKNGTSGRV